MRNGNKKMKITKEQAKVILDGEKIHKGLILRGSRLDWYYETERLLRGKDKKMIRGCKCEFKSLASSVHSLIDQYRGYLEELVNGKT